MFGGLEVLAAGPSKAHSLLYLRRTHGFGASRVHSGSLTYGKTAATVPLAGSRVQVFPQGFHVGQKILVGFTACGSRLGQKACWIHSLGFRIGQKGFRWIHSVGFSSWEKVPAGFTPQGFRLGQKLFAGFTPGVFAPKKKFPRVFVLDERFLMDSLLRLFVLGKRFLLDSRFRIFVWGTG